MKTKFLSLFFLVFLIISCQNDLDTDLTLRVITSSKLTVKVVDSKGTSIANANVKLYDRALLSSSSSTSYSSMEYLYSVATDANGIVDFGDVSAGTYFILIDSVRINGLNYMPVMQFQINSNVDKNITINPENYATTFNFSIKKTETSQTSSMVNVSAFISLNILLIPYSSYSSYSSNSSNYSLDQLISLAELSGKTNAAGYLSIKAPAYKSYIAFAYNDAKTVVAQLSASSYSSYVFSGDKDQIINSSFTLDSKTLQASSYGTFKLSIKKPVSSPTSTSPTIVAFEGLNVAAIPSTVYDSSLPLSVLLASAELSGKTDAAGDISFSLKSGTNYYFVVYNDNKTAHSILSGNSFYVNTGETRQTNFTINSTTLSSVNYTRLNVTLSKTSSVYYTSSPTDLTPFSNLQVALVPYFSSNSTASIDDLLLKTIASGTTNAVGQILFTLASSDYSNYYSYYQIVAYDAAKTVKFVSPSISLYSGNSTSQGYYLNATSLASVN